VHHANVSMRGRLLVVVVVVLLLLLLLLPLLLLPLLLLLVVVVVLVLFPCADSAAGAELDGAHGLRPRDAGGLR